MKILVTSSFFKPAPGAGKDSLPENCGEALALLRSFADEIILNPFDRPLSEDELIPLLSGCQGYIAGLDPVTQRVIESTNGLKVISRFGAGYDQVDIAAARKKGVAVCNTPDVNSNAVADLTFALLLSAARRLPVLDRKIRAGEWPALKGIDLYGKTMGILGFGAVGRKVAKRASGFSMRIMAYDPFIDGEYAKANGVTVSGFDEIIKEADFLCLHLPLNNETRHIISGDVMRKMKKGAVIVNTARGGILDEKAACELLASGHLGGLGLDVFENEPAFSSPLFELDNTAFTPHTAAHTAEAIAGMARLSVKNLIDVISGGDCPNIVN